VRSGSNKQHSGLIQVVKRFRILMFYERGLKALLLIVILGGKKRKKRSDLNSSALDMSFPCFHRNLLSVSLCPTFLRHSCSLNVYNSIHLRYSFYGTYVSYIVSVNKQFKMEMAQTDSGNIPKNYSLNMFQDFVPMCVFSESKQGK
jgi:hypothetical protein